MRVVGAIVRKSVGPAAAKERAEEMRQASAEDGGHASEPLPQERPGQAERAMVIPAENQQKLHQRAE